MTREGLTTEFPFFNFRPTGNIHPTASECKVQLSFSEADLVRESVRELVDQHSRALRRFEVAASRRRRACVTATRAGIGRGSGAARSGERAERRCTESRAAAGAGPTRCVVRTRRQERCGRGGAWRREARGSVLRARGADIRAPEAFERKPRRGPAPAFPTTPFPGPEGTSPTCRPHVNWIAAYQKR
jgi:hypothetical protein